MAPGEQFVTILGIQMMLGSFVVRLDILTLTEPPTQLILVREVARYCWITSTAGVMRVPLKVAGTMDGIYITAITVRMHQSSAQVSILLISFYCTN